MRAPPEPTIAGVPVPANIEIKTRKPRDPQKIWFKNVKILDSTGREPYDGEVLVDGERIAQVGKVDPKAAEGAYVVDGQGKKTLMSGLCDAHTHLSWNNSPTLDGLTQIPLEESVISTVLSAKCFLDCGFTMCFGAASARPRLDIVTRNSIASGMVPGPRYLANCNEISTTGGAIVPGVTKYADGPDEFRKVIREFIELGADNLKLSMTGDDIHDTMRSENTYITLEETKAAVEEAHRRGKRICGHARSAESVRLCLEAGIDVIYHASFIDEEGMNMLEAQKDRVFVAPAINFPLTSTTGEATPYGLTKEMAAKKGLKREVEVATVAMTEMHKRGIRVLPGGDYGFAWARHGTYARDLMHFVNMFGFTPMEAIIAATAQGGEIMGHPEELGKVLPGYYADLLLVNGNPLDDIKIFQDTAQLHMIMINGHIHKNDEFPSDIPQQDIDLEANSQEGKTRPEPPRMPSLENVNPPTGAHANGANGINGNGIST